MKISIFKDKKKTIDLPTFIDSRALVCANSGGGKSYAIRKILEECNNKVMSIVLDVEGEFKTLREKFDFLLVGQSGDVPLSMNSAHLLPRKLLELNISTIIDISDLKMHERIQYVKKFLEALMELPRKDENGNDLWKPCIIVIDEAHLLCGQQEKQDSTHAVIDVCTRGRKRGFMGILATQRIAKLHKDAVAELNNYIVGRTGMDIDQKRTGEILGFTSKEKILTLRDLEPGEFYVFGTAIAKAVEKEFIGEVQTTHPKVGMDVRKNIIPPTEEIKKVLAKLADLPEEAKKDLKDKEELRKEVIRLRNELAKKPIPIKEAGKTFTLRDVESARHQGYKTAEDIYSPKLHEAKSIIKNAGKEIEYLKNVITRITQIASQKHETPILETTHLIVQKPEPLKDLPHIILKPVEVTKEYTPESTPEVQKIDDSDTKLDLASRKIHAVLRRHRKLSITQVAVLTGYSRNSGSFMNSIYKLNAAQLIKRNSSDLEIIDNYDSLSSDLDGKEYSIKQWLNSNKLDKCSGEVFKIVYENRDRVYTDDEIAEISGYTKSGSFMNSIYKLNGLGLIERKKGTLQFNPELIDIIYE